MALRSVLVTGVFLPFGVRWRRLALMQTDPLNRHEETGFQWDGTLDGRQQLCSLKKISFQEKRQDNVMRLCNRSTFSRCVQGFTNWKKGADRSML